MDGYSYLTFDQRREIEALYSDGERAVDIAAKIGRSVAAIYEELKRGYTGELDGNKPKPLRGSWEPKRKDKQRRKPPDDLKGA